MIQHSDKYADYFSGEYLMGPNSVRLLDELLIRSVRAVPSSTWAVERV